MSDMFRSIEQLSIDRVAGMEIPEEPLFAEVNITNGTPVAVSFPEGIETHSIIIDSDIPIYHSFYLDALSGGAHPRRGMCRQSRKITLRKRMTTLYVQRRFAGQTGTVFITFCN